MAARLIALKTKQDHNSPILCDHHHWLPIKQRINFKILCSPTNPSCDFMEYYSDRVIVPCQNSSSLMTSLQHIRNLLTLYETKTRRHSVPASRSHKSLRSEVICCLSPSAYYGAQLLSTLSLPWAPMGGLSSPSLARRSSKLVNSYRKLAPSGNIGSAA